MNVDRIQSTAQLDLEMQVFVTTIPRFETKLAVPVGREDQITSAMAELTPAKHRDLLESTVTQSDALP